MTNVPEPEIQPPAEQKKDVHADRAMLAVIAAGLLLRLWHYARNPSMWHDEAATCVNILNKSFTGLFGHLDHSATGPSLLLAMQQCVVAVMGDSTYALRLISMLASCAGLLVLARLCRSLLDPFGALIAVAMAAFSDRLLWHASEARHYSSDFLFGALALLLFARTIASPLSRRLAVFAIFAPFAILLSYPGMFLCTGVMVALMPELRNARAWAGWLALGAWMAALAAFFYFFTIKPQRSAEMDAAWVSVFPDMQKPWMLPVWFVARTVDIFDFFVRPWIGGVLIVPAIAGAMKWWKGNKRGLVVAILVPMGCAVLAALIKSYPYTGARTMVYCLPGLALLAGAGVDPFYRWSRRVLPGVLKFLPCLLVCVPIVASVIFAIYIAIHPWKRADTAGASAYVLEHRQPGDAITSNHWEYEYYFRNTGPAFSADFDAATRPSATGPGRLWLVLNSGAPGDRGQLADVVVKRGWKVEDRREFQNATVFLLSRVGQK